MKCSYCGHENLGGDLFCTECGQKLDVTPPISRDEVEEVRCENCGVMNPKSAPVCRNCSQPLGKKQVSKQGATPGPTPPGKSQACPECGFDKNPVSAQFCMNCGKEITPGTPLPPPQEPLPIVQPVARLVLPTMKEIEVTDTEKSIGRADFLEDIPPDDVRFLSRIHFRIMFENGRYYILDEGSANGTKLNGVQIKGQGKKELNENDEIFLADTVRLRFQLG